MNSSAYLTSNRSVHKISEDIMRDNTDSEQIIPLRDIWALEMPGTRPMNRTMRGEPLTYESPEGLLVDEIQAALAYDPVQHPVAREGFAVGGEGMDALREAHGVIVQKRVKRTSFRKDEKISLVFFSYSFGSYVHLVEARQSERFVQLSYRFVPHETREVTAHLALIPLSNLKIGTIRVEVKPRLDRLQIDLDWEQWVQKIVCRSFSFNVTEVQP